jgi:hypothetical protein
MAMAGDDSRTLADRLRAAAEIHDDALLSELRRIAKEADPAPSSLLEVANAAFLTRDDLDAELAVLVADSREATATLGFEQVRADAEPGGWLMSFVAGGVQIDIEVGEERGGSRLIGQLVGAAADECYLEFADGERHRLEVDDLGRFIVEGLRHGPVRVRCCTTDGALVTTAWVTI